MTLPAAVALAGVLALAAFAGRWLTKGGALAALSLGTILLAAGGLRGGALLAVFFVSGSILTYTVRGGVIALAAGERRGRHAWQVAANGSWAAAGSVLLALGRDGVGWAALVGALAAAQADTWATEIGRFSPRPPRLLTTGRAVPIGTSGAVSPLGTLGGVVGGALMAGLAWALGISGEIAAAALAGGVLGMTADSLLGATVQAVYYCEVCAARTESPRHACGRAAVAVGGWKWLDNHAVNFVATGVGAASAVALSFW